MITKLLVILVVAIVTIIEDSQENLAAVFVLTLAQILVQDNIITTPLNIILHTMIVIDLVIIKNTKTLFHVHIILLASIILQHLLLVHINLTLHLVNAPLAIIIPLSDAINHHSVLLLNYVLITIEVDLTLTQEITQILNINLISHLTQQPTPNIHQSPSTEPKFEINMYHPNTSSCYRDFSFTLSVSL